MSEEVPVAKKYKPSPEYNATHIQICTRLKRDRAARFKEIAEANGTTMAREIRRLMEERIDQG